MLTLRGPWASMSSAYTIFVLTPRVLGLFLPKLHGQVRLDVLRKARGFSYESRQFWKGCSVGAMYVLVRLLDLPYRVKKHESCLLDFITLECGMWQKNIWFWLMSYAQRIVKFRLSSDQPKSNNHLSKPTIPCWHWEGPGRVWAPPTPFSF